MTLFVLVPAAKPAFWNAFIACKASLWRNCNSAAHLESSESHSSADGQGESKHKKRMAESSLGWHDMLLQLGRRFGNDMCPSCLYFKHRCNALGCVGGAGSAAPATSWDQGHASRAPLSSAVDSQSILDLIMVRRDPTTGGGIAPPSETREVDAALERRSRQEMCEVIAAKIVQRVPVPLTGDSTRTPLLSAISATALPTHPDLSSENAPHRVGDAGSIRHEDFLMDPQTQRDRDAQRANGSHWVLARYLLDRVQAQRFVMHVQPLLTASVEDDLEECALCMRVGDSPHDRRTCPYWQVVDVINAVPTRLYLPPIPAGLLEVGAEQKARLRKMVVACRASAVSGSSQTRLSSQSRQSAMLEAQVQLVDRSALRAGEINSPVQHAMCPECAMAWQEWRARHEKQFAAACEPAPCGKSHELRAHPGQLERLLQWPKVVFDGWLSRLGKATLQPVSAWCVLLQLSSAGNKAALVLRIRTRIQGERDRAQRASKKRVY